MIKKFNVIGINKNNNNIDEIISYIKDLKEISSVYYEESKDALFVEFNEKYNVKTAKSIINNKINNYIKDTKVKIHKDLPTNKLNIFLIIFSLITYYINRLVFDYIKEHFIFSIFLFLISIITYEFCYKPIINIRKRSNLNKDINNIEFARIINKGKVELTSPKNLDVGDIVIVDKGEYLCCDGVCLNKSIVNVSNISSKNEYESVNVNSIVLSGNQNLVGKLFVRVERKHKDSIINKYNLRKNEDLVYNIHVYCLFIIVVIIYLYLCLYDNKKIT